MVQGIPVSTLAGGEAYSSEFNGVIENVEVFEKKGSYRAILQIKDDSNTHIVPLFFVKQTEAGSEAFADNGDGTADFDDEMLTGWEASRVRGEKQESGYYATTFTLNKPAPAAPTRGGNARRRN